MSAEVTTADAFEDSGITFLARIAGPTGADALQADFSSISYKVFALSDTSAAVATGTVTVSSSIFDTLQTDARWGEDATGYNFRHTIGASVFSGPDSYRVEYKFTPASGEVFWHAFEVRTRELYSS